MATRTTITTHIYVEPELHWALGIIAAALGISVKDLTSTIVRGYTTRPEHAALLRAAKANAKGGA